MPEMVEEKEITGYAWWTVDHDNNGDEIYVRTKIHSFREIEIEDGEIQEGITSCGIRIYPWHGEYPIIGPFPVITCKRCQKSKGRQDVDKVEHKTSP